MVSDFALPACLFAVAVDDLDVSSALNDVVEVFGLVVFGVSVRDLYPTVSLYSHVGSFFLLCFS